MRGLEHAEFTRSNSYIGVMIDDLTTRGVTEPYRMFTSRAEFRLSLRADNSDQRLTDIGTAVGCIGERRQRAWDAKRERLLKARQEFEQTMLSAASLAGAGARLNADGPPRSAWAALALDGVSGQDVADLVPGAINVPTPILEQLKCDGLYEVYTARQASELAELNRQIATRIPPEMDLAAVEGLSNELAEKITRIRPRSMSDVKKIEGMTPSAEILLLAAIKRHARAS